MYIIYSENYNSIKMLKNTIFTLNKRPKGIPDNNCWKLIDSPIRNIKKNEILIQNMYLSIDPYIGYEHW